MARHYDTRSIFDEGTDHPLPALQSETARKKLASAISEANLREDFLTVEVFKDLLECIATHVSDNIAKGIDIAGAITSKKPDQSDFSEEGNPLRRSPRERVQDAIPRMNEDVFEPLICIQMARDGVEEAKSFLGKGVAEKLASKNLDKAMNQAFIGVEANAYQQIAKVMRTLGSDYTSFIKKYEGQILGETQAVLNDAVTIAAHAAQIAEVEYITRAAPPHIA